MEENTNKNQKSENTDKLQSDNAMDKEKEYRLKETTADKRI